MKFTAVGDAIIQKRMSKDYSGFETISKFIQKGDARYFNLETTVNEEGECFASQFCGGTHLRTSKRSFLDILNFGFNMTSFNNNHTFDYSYDGFYRTCEAVKESGLVYAGVGLNIAEAAAPKYLETPKGRVALISVSTSFKDSMLAGEQTSRVKGRPGVNGLRVEKSLCANEEDFECVKRMGIKSGINSNYVSGAREGSKPPLPENVAMLGTLRVIKSDETGLLYTINSNDVKRVQKAIEVAKWAADEVIISIHSHQQVKCNKEAVPEFLRDFAHLCIDTGANAVVGHGPHLLRPIEIYKDSPIFYSLGNFMLQLYDLEYVPAEMYEKHNISPDKSIYEFLKERSKNFTIGLMEEEKMSQSIIPYWETENGKLKYLEFLPIKICMDGNRANIGLPFAAEDDGFMERLKELSGQFGVDIVKKDGKYICR